ncbi:response regulator transcription factor [Streptomyces sp. NBC_00239]|uniref:response regulator transcription factor n=1 Tax=Streptomyces sp. NBC_00239 TaxID=2903640 RepID=UPI002E2C928D|nr:response regulator transcription factor [Streptomyces sp. NBC_00239]
MTDTTPAPVRVLVVDDQQLIREGIASLLGIQPGIEVVGTASDGHEAVARARELAPDVVLMDVRMPGMDGVQAVAALRHIAHAGTAPGDTATAAATTTDGPTTPAAATTTDGPTTPAAATTADGATTPAPAISTHTATTPGAAAACRVVMLTTFDDEEYVVQALRAGADGYLLKDLPPAELAAAVRLVHRGVTQLAPAAAARLVAAIGPGAPRPADVLTAREADVLRLIADGATNREIAAGLFLSEGTVKNHISRILHRLGLRDRTQAALYARDHGLL